MKNRYDEAIKNVEVTPEMRERILENINHLDLNKVSKKVSPMIKYKNYLGIAACFVLIFLTSVIYKQFTTSQHAQPPQVNLGGNGIIKQSTLTELSKTVGFTMKELKSIPFIVESVEYTSLWGNLGEIKYQGESQTVVYRMAASKEDISGDYSDYAKVEKQNIDGYDVILKGKADKFYLATWSDNQFSYSIQTDKGVSKDELITMIESVK